MQTVSFLLIQTLFAFFSKTKKGSDGGGGGAESGEGEKGEGRQLNSKPAYVVM